MDYSKNRTQSNGNPNNYALNGKIMLCSVIILFLIVVVIALFHSYARWCFYRRNRTRRLFSLSNRPNISAAAAATPLSHQALDLSVLKSLPTFLHPPTKSHLLECAVCLSEFDAGDRGRLLPKCNHAFHVECIDMWFQSHSSCPLCRAPVNRPDSQIQPQNADHIIIIVNQLEANEPPAILGRNDEMGRPEIPSGNELLPVWCQRKPLEVVGMAEVMEMRRESDKGMEETGRGTGSTRNNGYKSAGNGGLSLKRIWSV